MVWLLSALACSHCPFAQQTGKKDSLNASQPISKDNYTVPAQERPFIVRHIVIEGNKKTRENIILRELFSKQVISCYCRTWYAALKYRVSS